ncbi:HlyD family secretion protein [Acinetobacter puyangensis]|uniref:Membrane fusion protein, multidrug efflux system n=1 Tax=Acinetobacter puyangensis TaxID=1096779 RepID=A0A240EB40_9GAMM|nr:HlyD family secretion protein [Acinetobacter puyangensis]SNX45761.1 membrane fusion protein, multidrug efflux system [Acinetobacter puyangensis]
MNQSNPDLKKTTTPFIRLIIVSSALIIVFLMVYFIYTYMPTFTKTVKTDNAYIKGNLTYISTKVSGYIDEINVNDNEVVHQGQVLVRIDPRDYLVKIDQTKAEIEKVLAEINQLNEEIKLQHIKIKSKEIDINSANSSLEKISNDFKRAQQLINIGAISRSEYDVSSTEQQIQKNNLLNSIDQKNQEIQSLNILESSKSTLKAELNAANAKLKQAELDKAATIIRSPINGQVTSRNIEQGEYTTVAKNIMAIAPNQNLWLEANIKETQLHYVNKGDKVLINVDALPNDRFCGEIESLSKVSGSETSLIQTDNASGNFTKIIRRFPIKIKIVPHQKGLDKLGIGMSSVIKIYTHSSDKSCTDILS